MTEEQKKSIQDRYKHLVKTRGTESDYVQGFRECMRLVGNESADVRPVVLCEKCKHYKGENEICWLMRAKQKPNDFCSHGETRTEEEKPNWKKKMLNTFLGGRE